jgi:hypothetical protein
LGPIEPLGQAAKRRHNNSPAANDTMLVFVARW